MASPAQRHGLLDLQTIKEDHLRADERRVHPLFEAAGAGAPFSIPYADPAYHREDDTPDRVDLPNVAMATRLSLAAGLRMDVA